MPSRPTFRLRSIVRPYPTWTIRPVPDATLFPRRIQIFSFHSSGRQCSATTTNHYETLHLTSNASPADIKRQFYTLSKQHHPDRNPDDPTASTRFVAISEAYHVLSVPEKRAQYDLQLQHSQAQSRSWRSRTDEPPKGSYSSASFGSRPASGLNKKRSTFRGPPPSFYKSGGYGQQGAKRAEYAQYTHSSEAEAGSESYGEEGGFGPGQQKHGNQVRHFNDRQHRETHNNIMSYITRRRKGADDLGEDYKKGDFLTNLFAVSFVIGIVSIVTVGFSNRSIPNGEKRKGVQA